MNESPLIASPAGYKDRSTGLLVFGILLILLGALCALFVPLMILGQTMSASHTGMEPNYRMILPGAVMYGALAVAFIWLGIGSIKARRWARALMLVLSWAWLVTGVTAFAFLAVLLPQLLKTATGGKPLSPPGMRTTLMAVAFVIWAVMFLVIPACSSGSTRAGT